MSGVFAILKTAFSAYGFAVRAFVPSSPYLLAFAAMTALFAALPRMGLSPALSTWGVVLAGALAFVLGNAYSAHLYGLALRLNRARPARDDISNLMKANIGVYFIYLFIFAVIAIFVLVWPMAVVLATTELNQEILTEDPSLFMPTLQRVLQSAAGLLIWIPSAIAAFFVIFIALRLVLFGITTFSRGKVRVFSTWSWTRESTGRIAALALFTHLLPFVLVAVIVVAVGSALGSGALGVAAQTFTGVVSGFLFFGAGHAMAAKVYLDIAPNLTDSPRATDPIVNTSYQE